jgi:hypothetical protein
MLPVPYFHITVTVPAELRAVLRAHQSDGYAVLMQATAAAIIERAGDPRFVGGTVGVLAVLHTWDQQLNLPPHVHCLVSGGGISDDGTTWPPARRNFLLPIKALARKVRGKLRALLQRRCPGLTVPDVVWHTALDRPRHRLGAWRADRARRPRPLRLPHRHHQRPHRRPRRRRGHLRLPRPQDRTAPHLPAQRRRVHASLPPARAAARLAQVRYFGLWHPAHREDATRVRQMLQLQAPPPAGPPPESAVPPDPAEAASRRRLNRGSARTVTRDG